VTTADPRARTGLRSPRRRAALLGSAAFVQGLAPAAWAAGGGRAAAAPVASPEARLIEIYRLIGQARTREALDKAQALVRDVPNFQLAQLVHGDLLMARRSPLAGVGGGLSGLNAEQAEQLQQWRREAQLRLKALQEAPPAGAMPRQFLELPASTRHAIAVDASRARLYLFERDAGVMRVKAHHYASLGRLGIGKQTEGDQRTPLGVYYITSRLEPQQLKDFYGAGALPLNYPNEYDRRQGRSGSGIWLHGVPSESYARSPQTTDGCVALANDDLGILLRTVQPRSTPVVIAERLDWARPEQIRGERQQALDLIERWRRARAAADLAGLRALYSRAFASGNLDAVAWDRQLATLAQRPQDLELKDLAVLAWRDRSEVLVVTFGEVPKGRLSGTVKRQYWGKEGGQWKIFFEGVI
jgi:hypothetical protein